jgi:hypothetical protein
VQFENRGSYSRACDKAEKARRQQLCFSDRDMKFYDFVFTHRDATRSISRTLPPLQNHTFATAFETREKAIYFFL